MRLMAEHKYGLRTTTLPGWKEFFRKLGEAAVTLQLLQNKLQHATVIKLNDPASSNIKGKSILRYSFNTRTTFCCFRSFLYSLQLCKALGITQGVRKEGSFRCVSALTRIRRRGLRLATGTCMYITDIPMESLHASKHRKNGSCSSFTCCDSHKSSEAAFVTLANSKSARII